VSAFFSELKLLVGDLAVAADEAIQVGPGLLTRNGARGRGF
jgi:hypothetical protein